MALLFGVLLASTVHAMTVEVHGHAIYASGPVDDDYLKFQKAFAQPGIETVVLVNSPGGALWDGMHVANLIKEKGVKTVIAGFCNSACAIMFMGGKERSFSDAFRPAQTYIGIHGPHNILTNAVDPRQAVQILTFLEKSMADRFNAKVMKMALYDMDDADALLRVFDVPRLPKRVAYHCRSAKTLRKDCTEIPDQDALTLGIVTTNDFTKVDLPAALIKAPNVAGRELSRALAEPAEYFKALGAQQCISDHCRKLITDFVANKENKALAIPVSGPGLGTISDRESETNAFLSAVYSCNHVKDKPARLCETQVVNGFDVHDFYASSATSHAKALAKLTVPPEKYYASEEFGGGFGSANGLRTQDFDGLSPQQLDGIKKFNTQELALALKSSQAPVLIDVWSFEDAIPSALTLILGGLAFDDPAKEAPYAERFSNLLKLLSPDTEKPIVFYSKGRDWLSANAAMRAKKLGYTQVGWYRGGLDGWKAASLPVAPAAIRAVVQ